MLYLIDVFVLDIQIWLYVDVVQLFFFKFNLMDYDEDIYDVLYWVIIGVLQMVLMFVLLCLFEVLLLVECWKNCCVVWVDVIYMVILKFGIYMLFFFFVLQLVFDSFQVWLCLYGVVNVNFDYLWLGVML